MARSFGGGRKGKSRGAIRAEMHGLESARDASRRLKLKSWRVLEAFADQIASLSDRSSEYHHERPGRWTIEVDYRKPKSWDTAAFQLRKMGVSKARRLLEMD